MRVEIVKVNVPGLPMRLYYDKEPKEEMRVRSRPHLHDDIEILAGLSGGLLVEIGEDKVELYEGDVIIINRRVPHATRDLLPYTANLMLQFRIERIHAEEFENMNKYLALILAGEEAKYTYIKHGEGISEEIISLVKKMCEENECKGDGYMLFLRGYMDVLLGSIYRAGILKNISELYKRETVSKIWPAIKYVEDNFNRDITLDKLSATLGVKKEYFCRIFKDATGITPIEYVNFVRVWKAENMLTTTRSPVIEIAMDVGFSSLSYFNRVFRKYRGMTPTAYREILYAKNILM